MIVYNGVRQGWIDGFGREKIQKIRKKSKKIVIKSQKVIDVPKKQDYNKAVHERTTIKEGCPRDI